MVLSKRIRRIKLDTPWTEYISAARREEYYIELQRHVSRRWRKKGRPVRVMKQLIYATEKALEVFDNFEGHHAKHYQEDKYDIGRIESAILLAINALEDSIWKHWLG